MWLPKLICSGSVSVIEGLSKCLKQCVCHTWTFYLKSRILYPYLSLISKFSAPMLTTPFLSTAVWIKYVVTSYSRFIVQPTKKPHERRENLRSVMWSLPSQPKLTLWYLYALNICIFRSLQCSRRINRGDRWEKMEEKQPSKNTIINYYNASSLIILSHGFSCLIFQWKFLGERTKLSVKLFYDSLKTLGWKNS